MSRDDETEPRTRMLGTIEHAHTTRKNEPQRRPSDPDKTRIEVARLEIARPIIASEEPDTKIVDPSTFRSALSLCTTTLPDTPRPSPHDDITVLRPRLSIRPHDVITAPGPERRTMPFVLALLLAVLCIASGALLLRPRARSPKLAAAQPTAAEPAQALAPGTAAGLTAVTDTPATQPVKAAPGEPRVQVKATSDQGEPAKGLR